MNRCHILFEKGLILCIPGLILIALVPALAQEPVPSDSGVIDYAILIGGNEAGFYKEWSNADGSKRSWLQYNDRGRGDSLRTTWRMNDRGFPISIDVTGNDYYKNRVHETFSIGGGIARWENESEKEEQNVTGERFYVLLHGFIDVLHALETSKGRVQLLPSGALTLDTSWVEDFVDHGSRLRLTIVQTSGLGLSPSYTWYDSRREFFASVSDWNSVILRNHKDLEQELLARQKQAQDRYYNTLGRKLTETPERGIAIVHANLFDAERGIVVPGTTVLVRDSIIEEVVADSNAKVPQGYRVIDARGKMLIPGLWDMHVHYGDPEDGLLHLAGGVTSVRDLGNSESLLLKKKQIDDGELPGPRIACMAGLIDGDGPYRAPVGKFITSAAEGKEAIRAYARAGYQRIKLYSSIKPEWVKELTAEAKRLGLGIGGHIPAYMTAEEAVNAGYEEIQHINMLFLNFFGDTVDTRTPMRFSLVARHAADIDTVDPRVRRFVMFLRDHHITVDPTVGAFEDMFTSRPGKPSEGTALILPRLPIQFQRGLRSGLSIPVPEGMDSTYRRSFDAMLHLIRMLFNSGVRLEAGTDGLAGFGLHRELELYRRAGIPATDVLRMATLGAAEIVGEGKRLGSVEKGKLADLVLIDGNPVERMSDIRRTELVIKGGKIMDVRKIYQALSIKPAF